MKKIIYTIILLYLLSNIMSSCGPYYETSTLTSISGKVYRTIKIGNQWWMQENLMEDVYDTESELAGDTIRKYHWPDYNYNGSMPEKLIKKLGYNYNWHDAVCVHRDSLKYTNEFREHKRQGICPNGWHIPNESEFRSMIYESRKSSISGLREISGWDPFKYNGESGSGFAALPTNYKKTYYNGYKVSEAGFDAYFLSSTKYKGLHVHHNEYSDNSGEEGSIRCVRDE